MNPEYALTVLKKEKDELKQYEKSPRLEENPKIKTKLIHNLASLDFAIELLEEYMD